MDAAEEDFMGACGRALTHGALLALRYSAEALPWPGAPLLALRQLDTAPYMIKNRLILVLELSFSYKRLSLHCHMHILKLFK